MTHTPGPWKVEKYKDGRTSIVHSVTETSSLIIADLGIGNGPSTAHLIAGAPELLSALKALAEDHRQLNGPCGCYGQRDRCINCDAEAAIAKAEGKEVVR
jgi:hypothetical protein